MLMETLSYLQTAAITAAHAFLEQHHATPKSGGAQRDLMIQVEQLMNTAKKAAAVETGDEDTSQPADSKYPAVQSALANLDVRLHMFQAPHHEKGNVKGLLKVPLHALLCCTLSQCMLLYSSHVHNCNAQWRILCLEIQCLSWPNLLNLTLQALAHTEGATSADLDAIARLAMEPGPWHDIDVACRAYGWLLRQTTHANAPDIQSCSKVRARHQGQAVAR